MANTDVAGSGPAHRESFDLARLSPMTKTASPDTVAGPNRRGSQEREFGGTSSGASSATYGSSRRAPLIVSFPAGSQQTTVSPPTAMTRLRRGDEVLTQCTSSPWNSTMSPRSGVYPRPTVRTVMTCPALTVLIRSILPEHG